jgi:hypothetical protein
MDGAGTSFCYRNHTFLAFDVLGQPTTSSIQLKKTTNNRFLNPNRAYSFEEHACLSVISPRIAPQQPFFETMLPIVSRRNAFRTDMQPT